MSGRDTTIGVWVGCYTADMDGRGTGIVALGRGAGGAYSPLGPGTPVDSPSFLALHPSQPVLYAVSEGAGTVGAYRYDAQGGLSALGPALAAGSYACHVAVDPAGAFLVISCWGDGSVVLVELEPDGSLGNRHVGAPSLDPHGDDRQSRAHCCLMLGDGLLVTTDMGHDAVRLWGFSPNRGLDLLGAHPLAYGSGPRHLVRSARGLIYVITQHSEEVAVLRFLPSDTSGARLESRAVIAIRPAVPDPGDEAAEICLDPAERHLYVGVRGPNRIYRLRIGEDGTPAPLDDTDCGGVWPRHHCIADGRLFVALERSHEVASFEIRNDGAISQPVQRLPLGSPSCVLAHR